MAAVQENGLRAGRDQFEAINLNSKQLLNIFITTSVFPGNLIPLIL